MLVETFSSPDVVVLSLDGTATGQTLTYLESCRVQLYRQLVCELSRESTAPLGIQGACKEQDHDVL